MAAALMKFLCVLVLCSLIVGGDSQACTVKNLKIAQSRGGKFQHKPEWKVTITNDCACTQERVKLNCIGFQTAEDIDPSILRKSGGACLVNDGRQIYAHEDFSFNYAWDTPFHFAALSSQVACS